MFDVETHRALYIQDEWSIPHFLDQTRLSVQNKYKKPHFAWNDVIAHAESRQVVEWKR